MVQNRTHFNRNIIQAKRWNKMIDVYEWYKTILKQAIWNIYSWQLLRRYATSTVITAMK